MIKILQSKKIAGDRILVMLERTDKKRTLVINYAGTIGIRSAMPADGHIESTWSHGRREETPSFAGVDHVANWYSKTYVKKIWNGYK